VPEITLLRRFVAIWWVLEALLIRVFERMRAVLALSHRNELEAEAGSVRSRYESAAEFLPPSIAFMTQIITATKELAMTIEHHDLVHDFPELRDRIHELKISNNHFRRLFDEYHELTTDIENMEAEVKAVSTHTEEEAKMRRVHLKDELYKMLTA